MSFAEYDALLARTTAPAFDEVGKLTAHQKGFLWGFREVGVALIPLTCVTAPGSPRLSSLSV